MRFLHAYIGLVRKMFSFSWVNDLNEDELLVMRVANLL